MLKRLLLTTALATQFTTAAWAVDVAVSIRPIHSVVATLMQGVGTPELLIEGNADPHTARLTPSKARALSNADLVIWVGPTMSARLDKSIDSLADTSTVITLMEGEEGEHGADKHDDHDDHAKEDKAEDGHDDHDHDKEAKAEDGHDDHDHDKEAKAEDGHDDHDHDKEAKAEDGHDDHDHDKEAKAEDKHDDHDHAKVAKAEDGHEGHDHHAHGDDSHVWLDPVEMVEMVETITDGLVSVDAANEATYRANAEAFTARLKALDASLREKTAAARESKLPIYQVHDSISRFMERYGLTKGDTLLGANTEGGSAQAVATVRAAFAEKPGCLLVEASTKPGQISTLTEDRDIVVATVDQLGFKQEDGPALYEAMMADLGDTIASCTKK